MIYEFNGERFEPIIAVEEEKQMITDSSFHNQVSNREDSKLSIRGLLAWASKSSERSFICSRWVRRDKRIGGNVIYLFAVGLPRHATRRKRRLSIRGQLAVTSKPPKKS